MSSAAMRAAHTVDDEEFIRAIQRMDNDGEGDEYDEYVDQHLMPLPN